MAGDVVWMDVLPAMQGFLPALKKGTESAAGTAGKTAGTVWSRMFSTAASDNSSKQVVAELEAASTKTKKVVDQEVAAISRARATEKEAASKVLLAEQALADARAKYGDDAARTSAAELKLEAARERQSAASRKLIGTEDSLKAAQREHRTATEQLAEASEKAEREADQQTTTWGRLKSTLGQSADQTDSVGSSLGKLVGKLAAVAGGVALLGAAWSQNMDLESGTAKLVAQLDLTQEESAKAGSVAGSLYADGWGESVDEVTTSVGSVISSITGLREASESELQDAAGAALAFSQVFDQDVSESARNAGILIKNGLAPDAVTAFDLMTAALKRVPESLRGEVMDATQEYSNFFAQLGIDGPSALGLLTSATELGQYGIDKMGDSIKEFTIRATDMSKNTSAAYDVIGLDTQTLTNKLLSGGESAEEAFGQIVTALRKVKDPSAQATAALSLFGTPLEDLGVQRIPTFLAALDPAASGLDDVAGSAKAAGDALQDSNATGWEVLKRSAMEMLSDGLLPLMEPLAAVLDWARNTEGFLPAVAIGVGAIAAAWGVYTIAQLKANLAIAANPIGLIATAITLLIGLLAGAIVLIVNNWEQIWTTIKDIWAKTGQPIFDAVADAATSLWQWLTTYVFDPIATAWAALMGAFASPYETILAPIFDAIAGAATDLWRWLTASVFDPIADAWSVLMAGFGWAYEHVLSPIWDGIVTAGKILYTVLSTLVFAPIMIAWNLLADAFQLAWTYVIAPVWEGMKIAMQAAGAWLDENVFSPIRSAFEFLAFGFQVIWETIIKPAWDALTAGLQAGWAWIDEHVFGPIRDTVALVGLAFQLAWTLVIKPAWDALTAGLQAGWTWIDEHVFGPIRDTVALVGLAFQLAWTLVIKPAWENLKTGLKAGWDWINDNVFSPVGDGVDAVGVAFEAARRFIAEAWENLKTGLKAGWTWIDDHVFAPIRDGVDAVGKAFDATKDFISEAWDKVKKAAAAPVNFIIETVYTNGIKKTWDKIADSVNLDLHLPTVKPIGGYASGGVLPGWTPGRDVHDFWSPTGGSLSLSGGEAIMRPEFTRAVGGPAGVAELNRRARSGKFADGGVWGWAGDVWDKVVKGASTAWDWTTNAASAIGKFIADPGSAMHDLIGAPVRALLEKIGAGDLGQIIGGIPSKIVTGLTDAAKSLVKKLVDFVAPDSGGIGVAAMTRLVQQLVPGVRISSGYRPGAKVAGTNSTSYHARGRAIDMVGGPGLGAIWDALNAAYGTQSRELLYSPRGSRQILGGRRSDSSGIVKSMHYNHVHWAMREGGVVPLLFDEGGYLPPGLSLVANETGRPEPLARMDLPSSQPSRPASFEGATVVVRIGERDFEGYVAEVAGKVDEGDITPFHHGRPQW